ncbi:MAG TPA: NAD(P)-dependent oxidoreductase [Acidimicrobiales bacterium]
MIRVLSHVGPAERLRLPADLVERVEVVPVPLKGPVPDGLTGDVLISFDGFGSNLPELLDRGVRWVHFIGTGIDGFPLDRLGPDCVLTNSRGQSAVPIAEWVLACMLAFEKRLPEAWIDAPPAPSAEPVRLGTLEGRRLALLGLGGIGSAVVERARPFGMEIRALRRRPGPAPVDGVEMMSSVEELVDGAEHLVIVAPLTEETRGLVDRRLFAAMTPGVHLVNVARGGIVVTDDLRGALDDGTVALASLDVTDPEPLPAGHWMFDHPGVRVSSHVSWNWPHATRVRAEILETNLRHFLDGEPLERAIEPDVGY